MKRFTIQKLTVFGGGHTDSTIEFSNGFNLIIGPSNTGKSYIMDAIDYAFGFTPKPGKPSKIVDNNHGYTHVTLKLKTPNGYVTLTREFGTSKIKVTSTDYKIEDGIYSVNNNAKKNINSILLELIGISDEHRILANESGKTQALTFRTILHLFFMKQNDIDRENSALLHPIPMAKTPSIAALFYLLTSQDANELNQVIDPRFTKAKREAVMMYIRQKRDGLSDKRKQLEAKISEKYNDEIDEVIDNLLKEIDILQNELNEAHEKSNTIISKLYNQNEKLIECKTLLQSFDSLNTQYASDIRRLEFILDGSITSESIKTSGNCPICNSAVKVNYDENIIHSSSIELEKLSKHIQKLSEVTKTTEKRKNQIEIIISNLEQEKSSLDKYISSNLKTKLNDFQSELNKYMDVVKWKQELKTIDDNLLILSSDLHEKEIEDDSKPEKYNIINIFEQQLISEYEKKLISTFESVKFGGASSVRINLTSFDIEIDNKSKPSCMGGGYCAILNTLTTFAMQTYIFDKDGYAPGFFAIDSALTQLSEAEYIKNKDSIKHNFMEYMVSQSNSRQIIMIEQKDEISEFERDCNTKVIEFTRTPNIGRYGFLNDVVNAEHK
ncbi:AAA family ATPase [Granulicatella sp. zg-ZJ]|uniref:AAA family ATPase n=1 Tax=Granulicatella sp. zg-ZJ TaxID=2678504 RepID=UPI0013D52825|nr:AAA family ATPase [Granulicatella sp. zg-ZJ]NEW62264.1 AAA family ATPase [Granulicatella sp. zg-ZJ]